MIKEELKNDYGIDLDNVATNLRKVIETVDDNSTVIDNIKTIGTNLSSIDYALQNNKNLALKNKDDAIALGALVDAIFSIKYDLNELQEEMNNIIERLLLTLHTTVTNLTDSNNEVVENKK